MKERIGIMRVSCLILLCCIGMAGCGFFTADRVSGELSRSYQVTYDEALAATVRAMETQNLKITENSRMALGSVIRSTYYNGKPVTVRVTRSDVNITEISVRSGITGLDKDFSDQIHAAIAQELLP